MDSRGIDLDVYEELFFHVSNVTNGISSLTNLSSKDARNKDSLRERTDDDGEAPIEASQDDELVNASPNDSVDTPLNTSGAASAAASATASPQWCHLQAVAVVSLSILTGINVSFARCWMTALNQLTKHKFVVILKSLDSGMSARMAQSFGASVRPRKYLTDFVLK
jgi:hypothetical protein